MRIEKLYDSDYQNALSILLENILPYQKRHCNQNEADCTRLFSGFFDDSIKSNLGYALREGSELIGFFILAMKEEGFLHIKELEVHSQYQNKGFGTTCLAEIEGMAITGGYKGITLTVYKDNPAQNLYKRKGFSIIGDKLNGTAYKMEKLIK